MSKSVGYLLDTNILVGLIRGNAIGQEIDARFGLRSNLVRCLISVVTAGEMLSLARQFGWGKSKTDALEALLQEVAWIDINDSAILEAYGDIDHSSDKQGRPMGKNDVWIAATAKVTSTTLLTTDKDFDHLEGTFLNRIWIDPDIRGTP